MPFSLHPSGYCAYYNDSAKENLLRGVPCPFCRRVAGHSINCELYKYDDVKGHSSRPKLFNATSILWSKSKDKSFLTFTLPSLEKGTYQRDVDCPLTGDIVIASKFSRLMEAYSLRVKRRGGRLSYVWVAEAQMERQEKFGGVGDIHYHVIVNQAIKNNGGRLINKPELEWLQNLWCEHIGVQARNCLDVQHIPDGINSVPAYFAKYFGKGSQRAIIGRQFGATRDLTKYKPISLQTLPECELIKSYEYTTPSGYESIVRYYNTQEILETYADLMADESKFNSSRTDKNFTPDKIQERYIDRILRQQGSSYST